MRLSERRIKLVCVIPSMSRLDEVNAKLMVDYMIINVRKKRIKKTLVPINPINPINKLS